MRFSVLGYGDVQCRHTSSVRFAEGLRGFNRPLVEDNPHTVSENFGMGVGFDPPPGTAPTTTTLHPSDIEVLQDACI